MRRLAARAAAHWPASVTAAFLDFNLPSVPWALRGLAVGAVAPPIVVPALLTSAYHGRVDVPEVLAATGVAVRQTAVLGPAEPGEAPDPLLVEALRRRLSELSMGYDGLVLLAAGTSHADSALYCGVRGVGAVRGPVRAVCGWLRFGVFAVGGRGRGGGACPGRPAGGGERRTSWRLGGSTTPLPRRRRLLVFWVWLPLGSIEELVRLVLARAASGVAVARVLIGTTPRRSWPNSSTGAVLGGDRCPGQNVSSAEPLCPGKAILLHETWLDAGLAWRPSTATVGHGETERPGRSEDRPGRRRSWVYSE